MLSIVPIVFDSSEYWEIARIRERVLRMPLGLRYSYQELMNEQNEQIWAAKLDDQWIGSHQYIISNDQAKMRQVCILPKYQHKGYAQYMISQSENILKQMGIKYIYCHAREVVTGFYTHLGYQIDSETFLEVGIPHIKMYKRI